MLEVDGKELTQSMAIARYLAKELGNHFYYGVACIALELLCFEIQWVSTLSRWFYPTLYNESYNSKLLYVRDPCLLWDSKIYLSLD